MDSAATVVVPLLKPNLTPILSLNTISDECLTALKLYMYMMPDNLIAKWAEKINRPQSSEVEQELNMPNTMKPIIDNRNLHIELAKLFDFAYNVTSRDSYWNIKLSNPKILWKNMAGLAASISLYDGEFNGGLNMYNEKDFKKACKYANGTWRLYNIIDDYVESQKPNRVTTSIFRLPLESLLSGYEKNTIFEGKNTMPEFYKDIVQIRVGIFLLTNFIHNNSAIPILPDPKDKEVNAVTDTDNNCTNIDDVFENMKKKNLNDVTKRFFDLLDELRTNMDDAKKGKKPHKPDGNSGGARKSAKKDVSYTRTNEKHRDKKTGRMRTVYMNTRTGKRCVRVKKPDGSMGYRAL